MTGVAPCDFDVRDRAAAKLNLALEITGTTPDGYHTLRSVMIGLALADTIRITGHGRPSDDPEIRLHVRGGESDVPTDGRNLVVRAVRAFLEAAPGPWPERLTVRLDKRVPSQAGMGGGSADAGTALRMLARLRPLARPQLEAMALQLGSDVPFMLDGGAALAEGRGERLRPLRAPRSWWVVLVQPAERISTAWCYAKWDERAAAGHAGEAGTCVDDLACALEAGDLAGVAAHLCNDLEGAVLDLHPHLRSIPRLLQTSGCVGARMTGSGSVFFGLAPSRAAAQHAADAARAGGVGRVWITRTWREAR